MRPPAGIPANQLTRRVVEPNEAYQEFQRARFFPSLDGVRGISIIAVVWHHASGHQSGILGKGNLGVQLFFAISGFLITTLLLREQRRTGTVSLWNFYARRSLRIFPAYYAAILAYVVLVLRFDGQTEAGALFWHNLPAYLTYTSNWFVNLYSGPRIIFYFAWSLATEEQFYLVWPSIVRFGKRWWAPVTVMAGLLVVGEAVNWGVPHDERFARPLVTRILGSIASPICMGCLLAYLLHSRLGFHVAHRLAGRAWSAPLAFASLMVCLAFENTPDVVTSAAMTYLVATVAILPGHLMRWLTDNAALLYVGTISYGMYLFHMLAINFTRRVLVRSAQPLYVFLIALPIAIGMATLSYRGFEQRFLALKTRFGSAPPLPGSGS